MTREEILALVEERDIKFVRFWFTDILGQLKSFAVTREQLPVPYEYPDRDSLLFLLELQPDSSILN